MGTNTDALLLARCLLQIRIVFYSIILRCVHLQQRIIKRWSEIIKKPFIYLDKDDTTKHSFTFQRLQSKLLRNRIICCTISLNPTVSAFGK